MLIILLLLALIRSLHAVPISIPPYDLPAPLTPPDLQGKLGQRNLSDIIVSCLATIFACTWSAVHPNIPSLKDTKWMRFKRQIVIMVYALVAPEVMTAWALRQYLGAREIAKIYNKRMGKDTPQPTSFLKSIREWFYGSMPMEEGDTPAWTVVHGFFLQMGGFMLCENGIPIQTLTEGGPESIQLVFCINQNIIDIPKTTENEIQERSKGEAFSKAVIILQTTWFVVQCIARWSQQLSVTELEVVTFGFAVLNGATYALWWHKPQNVGRPIYLERKRAKQESKTESDSTSILLQTSLAKDNIFCHIIAAPFRLCQVLVRPLIKMMGSTVDNVVEEGVLCVPMFYSGPVGLLEVWGLTSFIGVVFGSIHLIPSWFLDFSTHREMLIWRISATIITVQPLMLGISALLIIPDYPTLQCTLNTLSKIIGVPIYMTARLVLLTLPFLSFGTLPPGVFQTVQWTSFIPHI